MLLANGRFLLNMFPLFAVSLGTRAEMPLMPSHRRALQTAVSTTVSTVDSLTSALANTDIGHIVLAPGTYYLGAELSVTRSVVIEAAVAGSVVLDARASSSSRRRVLFIDPGSSGVVQLIGLNITGGYVEVRAHIFKSSHLPRWEFLLTCPNRLTSFNSDPSLVLPEFCTC